MVSVPALVTGGHTGQMPSHFNRALNSGVEPAEIAAIITHVAFYDGWPNSISAVAVAKDVFELRGVGPDLLAPEPGAPLPVDEVSKSVRTDTAQLGGGIVTVAPGARTAWHTHPVGETLIVTAGCGWAQREGGGIEEIRPGDVVWIPPGAKHWHAADSITAFAHIAIAEALRRQGGRWMEQVSDEQYLASPQPTPC